MRRGDGPVLAAPESARDSGFCFVHGSIECVLTPGLHQQRHTPTSMQAPLCSLYTACTPDRTATPSE